jgi:hypothetical protein
MKSVSPLSTRFDIIDPGNVTAHDRAGLRQLLDDTLPHIARLTAELQLATEWCDSLQQTKRTRSAELADVRRIGNAKFLTRIQESNANPVYDHRAGAEAQLPFTLEIELRQEALNFLDYVLVPQATGTAMEIRRDLLRFEHLEAAIYAADSHAALLEKMEAAGIYETHGRVVTMSESTERLKAIANEAGRLAAVAEAELTDWRAKQGIGKQQRYVGGHITKAEALYAAAALTSNTTESSETK